MWPSARAAYALAFAAGDQNDWTTHAVERRLRGGDRRSLRIVDEQNATRLADRLHSVRQSAKTRQCIMDRPLQLDDRRRERECGERVSRVVAPDQRKRRRRKQPLAAARQPQRAVALHQTPFFFRKWNAFAQRTHRSP